MLAFVNPDGTITAIVANVTDNEETAVSYTHLWEQHTTNGACRV